MPSEFYYYHEGLKQNFKLAIVDLKIESFCTHTRDKGKYILSTIPPGLVNEIKDKYRKCINSLDDEVRIVIFGEMTFPSSTIKEDKKFENELAELAKKKNIYIVAGSYHDIKKKNEDCYYNVCPIFVPYQLKPILQYKEDAAAKAGERCERPISPKTMVLCTPFVNFTTLICLDAKNDNNWNAISAKNINSIKFPPIDLVICPTHDPSHEIIKYAINKARSRSIALAFTNSCVDAYGGMDGPTFQTAYGVDLTGSKNGLVHVYEITPDMFKRKVVKNVET